MRHRLFAVAAIAVAMSACGSSKADAEPVQVRPVMAECTADGTARSDTPAIGEAAALAWDAPDGNRVCATGPAADADGPLFTNAEVQALDGTFFVSASLVDTGASAFNALTDSCFQRDTACPTGQLAVTVDGRVLSVATVQTPTFEGSVQFAFTTEADAQTFVDAVNSGR